MIIQLPDDDPEAIRAMVSWLYNDKVCLPTSLKEDKSKHGEGATSEGVLKGPWALFVRLFIIGDKYDMPDLKNDAIDALITFWTLNVTSNDAIPVEIINYSYENTAKDDSPLRQLLIRIFYSDYDEHYFAKLKARFNPAVLSDMELVFTRGRNEAPNPSQAFCASFHDHSSDPGSHCEHAREYIVDKL